MNGDFSAGGGANYNYEVNEGTHSIPDPLADVPEPPIPMEGDPAVVAYPDAPIQLAGATKPVPTGCPDDDPATPATEAAPHLCQFNGSYAGTSWRMFPGYYPGGLLLEAGAFYLEPGIYYFAGGGIQLRGAASSMISVDPGTETFGGGVMLYNGDHATAADGAIDLGGGNASLKLMPIDDEGSPWQGISIFQDREVCLDARIVGGASDMEVRGTIYIPGGPSCSGGHPVFIAEGNGGDVTADQVIAFRFQAKGNGGSFVIAFDQDNLPANSVAGPVE